MPEKLRSPAENIEIPLPRPLLIEALEGMRVRIKCADEQSLQEDPAKYFAFNELVKNYIRVLEILEKADKDYAHKVAGAA